MCELPHKVTDEQRVILRQIDTMMSAMSAVPRPARMVILLASAYPTDSSDIAIHSTKRKATLRIMQDRLHKALNGPPRKLQADAGKLDVEMADRIWWDKVMAAGIAPVNRMPVKLPTDEEAANNIREYIENVWTRFVRSMCQSADLVVFIGRTYVANYQDILNWPNTIYCSQPVSMTDAEWCWPIESTLVWRSVLSSPPFKGQARQVPGPIPSRTALPSKPSPVSERGEVSSSRESKRPAD